MEEKFTVQIPVRYKKPLRILAAERDGTIQSAVSDILEDAFDDTHLEEQPF